MKDQAGDSGATAPDAGTRTVMLLGGALSSLAFVGINSVLPAIDTALAHSARDSLLVKQLAGVVGLAMMAGAILAGVLVERAGLRRILPMATLIYVAAGTAGLYLGDLRLLLASRFLLGVAAATIQISAMTLINARLEGAARAQYMGFHISAAMACTIIAQPIAGFLGGFGWRLPFALYALGLLLIPAMLKCREIPIVARKQDALSRLERSQRSGAFWRHFPYHYLPLAILVGSIVFLPMVYAPFLMRGRGVTDPLTISLLLTADSILGTLMASQYGRARRHISHYGAFAVSFGFAAAGTLIAGFSTGIFGFVAGMLVYGVGVGWLVPNLMTAVGEKLAPERQARAVGLVKAAHFLAGSVALLMVEPLARRYGPPGVIIAVAGLAFLLLVAALVRSRLTEDRSLSRLSNGLSPQIPASAISREGARDAGQSA